MATIVRTVALGVFISTMEIVGAGAQAYYQPSPAYAISAPPGTTLPEVFVPGQQGHTAPHYRVPAGYDSDVALHPYTSGLGPCPQAATPDQGCHHPTGHPIPPSHYERAPFTR